MLFEQLPVHRHMGSRRAEIQRGSRVRSVATEQLSFDGNGKVLIASHGFGVLAVEHHPAVPERPTGAPVRLLPDEAVFHAKFVRLKWLRVEQVTKLIIEPVVTVVADGQQAIFYTKSAIRVFTQRVTPNLGGLQKSDQFLHTTRKLDIVIALFGGSGMESSGCRECADCMEITVVVFYQLTPGGGIRM